jgi:hypothetical protein
VQQRADQWVATYSFNLTLLALACGESIAASEVFPDAEDAAGELRALALRWRASIHSDIWFNSVGRLQIKQVWRDERREVLIEVADDRGAPRVDPIWSHAGLFDVPREIGAGFGWVFDLTDTQRSMQLSNGLREDIFRHVAEPMMQWMPEACLSFMIQGPNDAESVGHSLVTLWLTSMLATDDDQLAESYRRAALAVGGSAWGPPFEPTPESTPAVTIVLKALTNDARRLPPASVANLIMSLSSGYRFDPAAHFSLAAACLLRIEPEKMDREARRSVIAHLASLPRSYEEEQRLSPHIRDLDLWSKAADQ